MWRVSWNSGLSMNARKTRLAGWKSGLDAAL
jgi:hypothetical protein